jgi:NTE family protein
VLRQGARPNGASAVVSTSADVAFVLGGGGVLGAHEVGMLRALCEAGIQPDAVVGTSVGALNGALIAAGFSPDAITHLTNLWMDIAENSVFGGSMLSRMGTLVRSRTHLHSNDPLRKLLEAHLPVTLIEELAVPFQCVAASIERAAAHWFTAGPIVDAVLASAAVPGLLPPVEIDGEHFFDGGLVHSIPVGRAVSLGARTVYVLQVGRVEEPLTPPSTPLQVGLIAFEIARRHRFMEEMRHLPSEVTVHVLPTGDPPKSGDLAQQLRYRDFSAVRARIEQAYEASAAYLAKVTS